MNRYLLLAGGAAGTFFLIFLFIFLKVYTKKELKPKAGTYSDPTTNIISSSSQNAPASLRSSQLNSGVASEDAPPGTSESVIHKILKMLKDPVLWGSLVVDQALSGVAEKIETKIRKAAGKKVAKVVINKAADAPERFIQKSGAKLAIKATDRTLIKSGIKAGEKGAAAGAKIAGQAAIAASSGPAAPFVEAAELAFNVFSGALDGLNLGGFANLTTMSALNDTRDQLDKYFIDGMKSVGSDAPIIYGPIDKMTQDAYDEAITNALIALIKADSARPDNPLNNDSYLDQKLEEAFSKICLDSKGVITKHPKTGEASCAYTQKDCVAPWPQETGDTYYEMKDGVCQVRQSSMRGVCEGLGSGVTYNTTTGSCNLTEGYCGRYAGIAKVKNGDCSISQGQQIAENIFGTTITRSILNIFDFKDNYEPCPAGSIDSGERIGNAPLGGPLSLVADFMCEKNNCSSTQEKMGGLCYPKCRDGYSSSWGGDGTDVAGMCYKTCDRGYNATAGFCTWLNPDNTPCPSDYPEAQGGMCYKKGVRHLAGGAVATTIVANKSACPSGQRDDGTSCWEDYKVKPDSCAYTIKGCKRWDYLTDASLIKDWCAEWGDVCQAGLKGSGCGCIKKTVMDRYSCPDGYSPSSSGLCQADAKPAKLSYIRDSYSRNPDGISLKVFPKKRKKDLGYPSTSEADFKNSTIGKYVQQGINSVRDGNMKGLGEAMGGIVLTTNPAALSLGLSDMVDIGYQKALNS
jgi:hypothetical protein